jgi:hypothetical protein
MRAALLVVLTSLAVGCGTAPPAKPVVPFALDAPPSLELLKGESPTFDVAVNWDKGERQDLSLSVAIEPDNRGVSARPVKARLERGVGPAQVVVTATETAAPGDYVLTISAIADTSGKARASVAVKVRAD